jgi:tRNA threonylcarbamoyladenosine modification (KEOPS) complex  Pcc1 subunit
MIEIHEKVESWEIAQFPVMAKKASFKIKFQSTSIVFMVNLKDIGQLRAILNSGFPEL